MQSRYCYPVWKKKLKLTGKTDYPVHMVGKQWMQNGAPIETHIPLYDLKRLWRDLKISSEPFAL